MRAYLGTYPFIFFLFLSLNSCSKISNPRSGKTIYGAFSVGAISGILRAVSPARPGNTDIVQNPMPSDPLDLEGWLAEPSGRCPSVNANFDPIPVPSTPPVLLEPAQCRAINSVTGTSQMNSSGPALWRTFDLCQYENMDSSPWIKSEMLMKFESSTDCTDFQSSGTLGSGKKVILTYGNGQNGDQQNRFFSKNGEVQYVYTDFPSGWSELKSGGVEVVFGADNKPSQIVFLGFEVKNWQQIEMTLAERALFKNIEENFQKNLEMIDHLTFSTATNLQVTYSANIPTVNSGQIFIQDNESGALLITQVGSPLVFSNPDCCWPTSGTLVTTATDKRNFSEVLTFTSTCGKADLNRPFRQGSTLRESYTLQYCF